MWEISLTDLITFGLSLSQCLASLNTKQCSLHWHKLFNRNGQRKETPSNEKGSTYSRCLIPISGWKNVKNRCWYVSGFFDKMTFLTDKEGIFFLSWIATNTDTVKTLLKILYFCRGSVFLSKINVVENIHVLRWQYAYSINSGMKQYIHFLCISLCAVVMVLIFKLFSPCCKS